MPVSKEQVTWCYRILLGRAPESSRVVREHMRCADLLTLLRIFLTSEEFLARLGERPEASSWQAALQGYAPQMVMAAYRGLLGRDADPEGLDIWSRFIHERRSLDEFLQLLSESAEFHSVQAPRLSAKGSSLAVRPPDRSGPSIGIFGNCQGATLARCIQALGGTAMPTFYAINKTLLDDIALGSQDLSEIFEQHDVVLMQPRAKALLTERQPQIVYQAQSKIILFPSILLPGFHPDLVYIGSGEERIEVSGPSGPYHSALAFAAWSQGWSVSETVGLYCDSVYRELGYYDYWDDGITLLLQEGEYTGMSLQECLQRWRLQGCFMHTPLRPKVPVMGDVAQWLLQKMQVREVAGEPLKYVYDALADAATWPVYPEIGKRLGVTGSYSFKAHTAGIPTRIPVVMLPLEEHIERSFHAYGRHSKSEIHCARMESGQYAALLERLRRRHPIAAVTPVIPSTVPAPRNPYQGLPSSHFWRSAVAELAVPQVDPVVRVGFTMAAETRIATAGSCFAQHISQALVRNGFNYYVTEKPPPNLPADETAAKNYGVFSARYGNLYTAKQLLQLFDRAYGHFVPEDIAWPLSNARWADPFRPQIEPNGFASAEDVESARSEHLAAVRHLFDTLQVFVFTLGLTEAWRSISDGAVFPLAPGVAAGEMDPTRYEFVDFKQAEVVADLNAFIARLRQRNPAAQVLLTVSPVPLIATAADRHVLTSTVYSKSVLRAAAEEVAQAHQGCDYFPSYEIITGNFSRGAYYDQDLRGITPAGVDHVMRLFFKHYAGETQRRIPGRDFILEMQSLGSIVCDEQRIASVT